MASRSLAPRAFNATLSTVRRQPGKEEWEEGGYRQGTREGGGEVRPGLPPNA